MIPAPAHLRKFQTCDVRIVNSPPKKIHQLKSILDTGSFTRPPDRPKGRTPINKGPLLADPTNANKTIGAMSARDLQAAMKKLPKNSLYKKPTKPTANPTNLGKSPLDDNILHMNAQMNAIHKGLDQSCKKKKDIAQKISIDMVASRGDIQAKLASMIDGRGTPKLTTNINMRSLNLTASPKQSGLLEKNSNDQGSLNLIKEHDSL